MCICNVDKTSLGDRIYGEDCSHVTDTNVASEGKLWPPQGGLPQALQVSNERNIFRGDCKIITENRSLFYMAERLAVLKR
jgi:hypothetical protein